MLLTKSYDNMFEFVKEIVGLQNSVKSFFHRYNENGISDVTITSVIGLHSHMLICGIIFKYISKMESQDD